MNNSRKITMEDIANMDASLHTEQTGCSLNTFLWKNNLDGLFETAIEYFNHKITFKEMRDNIWRAARALVKIGVKPGEVVTICSEMTPEVIYLFYAMDLMGAIPDLISPIRPFDEIRSAILQMETRVVICLDTVYPEIQKAIVGTLTGKVIVLSMSDSIKGFQKTVYKLKHRKKYQYDANVVLWADFFWLGMDPLDELSVIGYVPERIAAMLEVEDLNGESQKVLISTKDFNGLAEQERLRGYDRSRRYVNGMPPYDVNGLVQGVHAPLSMGVCSVIIQQEQIAQMRVDPDEIDEVDEIEEDMVDETVLPEVHELSFDEIEKTITTFPNVRKAVVVGVCRGNDQTLEMPFVFIKWQDESAEMRKRSMQEVKNNCEKQFSGNKVPVGYVSVKVIPVDEMGMIDRDKLRKQAAIFLNRSIRIKDVDGTC